VGEQGTAEWSPDPGVALDRLVASYGNWVLRLVTVHVDHTAAEDITQEVFLRAYRGWPRFHGDGGAGNPARLRAWLARISVNLCRDRWRQQRARRGTVPWEAGDEGAVAVAAQSALAPAAEADPELALLAGERSQALRAALRTLALPDRRVLLLYYYFDLDTPAIARMDGCPEATVRSRLLRARVRLRHRLEASDWEEETR